MILPPVVKKRRYTDRTTHLVYKYINVKLEASSATSSNKKTMKGGTNNVSANHVRR